MMDSHNKNLKQAHDDILGRALSRAISKDAAGQACPPLEDIAALVDGALSEEARDAMMRHLAGCERCYQTFVSTSEMLLEEGAAPPLATTTQTGTASSTRHYSIPMAVAAAVVLALALGIYYEHPADTKITVARNEQSHSMPQPGKPQPKHQSSPGVASGGKPNTPSTSGSGHTASPHRPLPEEKPDQNAPPPSSLAQLARALGRDVDAAEISASINQRKDSGYGFSGSVSASVRSFRLGVLCEDLEILLQGQDRANVLIGLKQIQARMQDFAADAAAALKLTEMIQRIEVDNQAPLSFAGCTRALESTLRDKDSQLYFQAGAWAEAGRLAAMRSRTGLITAESARYFSDNMQDPDLPAGVKRSLETIEKTVQLPHPGKKELGILQRAFSDLIAVF